IVGLLLPAAGPYELEERLEAEQVSGRRGRKEVRYAVDRVEGPAHRRLIAVLAGTCGRRCAGRAVRAGAEEREHAVDVDEQQRPLRSASYWCIGAFFSSHTGWPGKLRRTADVPRSLQRSKAARDPHR